MTRDNFVFAVILVRHSNGTVARSYAGRSSCMSDLADSLGAVIDGKRKRGKLHDSDASSCFALWVGT